MKKLSLSELHRLSATQFVNTKKNSILFCADQIRSGHNIGALFRIADAFAFEGIVLSPYCVKPPHPEIEKTALGASSTVSWDQPENMVHRLLELKNQGYFLIAIEQTDQSILLHQFKSTVDGKYVLIFGNEINGVSDEILQICHCSIEIPQHGTKHSLNVSVAAGIIAWEFIKIKL